MVREKSSADAEETEQVAFLFPFYLCLRIGESESRRQDKVHNGDSD